MTDPETTQADEFTKSIDRETLHIGLLLDKISEALDDEDESERVQEIRDEIVELLDELKGFLPLS